MTPVVAEQHESLRTYVETVGPMSNDILIRSFAERCCAPCCCLRDKLLTAWLILDPHCSMAGLFGTSFTCQGGSGILCNEDAYSLFLTLLLRHVFS